MREGWRLIDFEFGNTTRLFPLPSRLFTASLCCSLGILSSFLFFFVHVCSS